MLYTETPFFVLLKLMWYVCLGLGGGGVANYEGCEGNTGNRLLASYSRST